MLKSIAPKPICASIDKGVAAKAAISTTHGMARVTRPPGSLAERVSTA